MTLEQEVIILGEGSRPRQPLVLHGLVLGIPIPWRIEKL